MNDDFEYDYHNIVDNADELYDDEYYYDDGVDEPWMGLDENEDENLDSQGWENYYHNIANEIAED